MIYVLNNKKSGNSTPATIKFLASLEKKENKVIDVAAISNIKEFLDSLFPDDTVYILGGDGTLNHLINKLNGEVPAVSLYYVPAGSGNDFFSDVKT